MLQNTLIIRLKFQLVPCLQKLSNKPFLSSLLMFAPCKIAPTKSLVARIGAAKYITAADKTPKIVIKIKPLRNSCRPMPYSFKALYLLWMLLTAFVIMQMQHGSYVHAVVQSNLAAAIGALFGIAILAWFLFSRSTNAIFI